MNIPTVNVIIYGNPSDVTSVRDFRSFPDNPVGNEAAEKYFAKKIREIQAVSDDFMACHLDNGYYCVGGREFVLVHSYPDED